MVRKIAIVTTHRANNFGAMLQAYSLVMACRELGAEAEILDWRHPFFEWQYHSAWRMYRNPIPAIKHLRWYLTKEAEARRRFSDFRSLLPMSDVIKKRSLLQRFENKYDAFIVGSDQVWNPINSAINPVDFDRACLLDFVSHKKKYAYAASIGRSEINPPTLLGEFVEAWKGFDGITMREFAGARYVTEQIGKIIETVVDPVILHTAEYWQRLANCGSASSDLIIVYNIRRFSQLKRLAEDLAKKEGLRIVNLMVPGITEDVASESICAGPLDFITYVNSAKYVVTDSFHASAFASIFGKKLYVQYNCEKENANSRMDTLFTWAGIKGKSVINNGEVQVMYFDCAAKNDAKMDNEISRSKQILSDMLNGSYSN